MGGLAGPGDRGGGAGSGVRVRRARGAEWGARRRVQGPALLTPLARCRAAPGSLGSAMAPPPPCRPPTSAPRLLLLLLSFALLGAQVRPEPAAGSAVPAQSTCREGGGVPARS